MGEAERAGLFDSIQGEEHSPLRNTPGIPGLSCQKTLYLTTWHLSWVTKYPLGETSHPRAEWNDNLTGGWEP